MALDRSIIRAADAAAATFDYKAREISAGVSTSAKSFVDTDAARSPDFKISELVARQAGISQLESDAHQGKINAQVLERLKEVEERAYKEGHELGLIEGTEKSFQENKIELLEKHKALEGLLKRIEDLKGQLLIDNEAELIRLVFLIAKKIAMRDLEEHREAVLEILQGVVGEMQAEEKVVVKLSNEDLFFIETLQDKGGRKMESLKRVSLVADDEIKPGGCMIETEYGTVNATVEERVERTWTTLLSRVPKKQQPPSEPK